MTAKSEIIKRILDKIEKLPKEHLSIILGYVENLDSLDDKKRNILSFAGSWKDIDHELFEDLTLKLNKNRINETNSK